MDWQEAFRIGSKDAFIEALVSRAMVAMEDIERYTRTLEAGVEDSSEELELLGNIHTNRILIKTIKEKIDEYHAKPQDR